MSEAIVRDDINNDLEALINDVHKHFKGRIKNIEDRFNDIEKSMLSSYQIDTGKVKDYSKAKKVTKGTIATAAKTAANVELIASQEDVLTGNNLGGLGLFDRLKKGALSKTEISGEDSNKVVELAAKMKSDFANKLDVLENRIDTLDKGISSYEKSINKGKNNQSKGQAKIANVNDLGKAYVLINEMYEDLTKRFDNLEKKLDRIEKKIEKEMPGIKLENRSQIKKSVIGKAVDSIKGLFKNNKRETAIMKNKIEPDIGTTDKNNLDLKQNSFEDEEQPAHERDTNGYEPTADDALYELEAQARERAKELGIEYRGDEPKPFKAAHEKFKFGKFDANVILKEIENRSDDEFKEHLYSKYADSDKADSEYEMQSRRIEKLEEKGYIEKENEKYIITDKGKEAASEVNKSFQFTSYDSNVVFGYINKNNGQLSLEMLKECIDKEYKTKDEIDKQFSYLQKRLENNEKAGYLAKNEAGHYVITDKGKAAANRIELKRNNLSL